MLVSKPTNDSKTYSWNASTMQKQEYSTWMQTPFYNLFLDLESIGSKGEQRKKNVAPTRYCNPAEKYLS